MSSAQSSASSDESSRSANSTSSSLQEAAHAASEADQAGETAEQPNEEVVEVIEEVVVENAEQPIQEAPATVTPEETAPAPLPAAEPEPVANVVHVAVTVSSDAADGQVSASGSVELPEGSTAYDALVALGIPLDVRSTPYGMYVAGINGLNEKDYGGSSGWLYFVNGSTHMVSATSYILADGDVVDWQYTV